MKFYTKKEEEQIKKSASKIAVLADSLYSWFQINKDEIQKSDLGLRYLEHDIKDLRETAQQLFWKEL